MTKARLLSLLGWLMIVVGSLVIAVVVWYFYLAPLWAQEDATTAFYATASAQPTSPITSRANSITATPQVSAIATVTVAMTITQTYMAPTPIPAIPTTVFDPIPISTPSPHPTTNPTPEPKDFLMEIPKIHLKFVVHEVVKLGSSEPWGIPKTELDKFGVVRSPLMAYPGQSGLVAIAGHRDMSGSPFYYLNRLKEGDSIFLTLADGTKYTYTIYLTKEILPTDQSIYDTKYDQEIRLITCLIGSQRKRVVIYGYQN